MLFHHWSSYFNFFHLSGLAACSCIRDLNELSCVWILLFHSVWNSPLLPQVTVELFFNCVTSVQFVLMHIRIFFSSDTSFGNKSITKCVLVDVCTSLEILRSVILVIGQTCLALVWSMAVINAWVSWWEKKPQSKPDMLGLFLKDYPLNTKLSRGFCSCLLTEGLSSVTLTRTLTEVLLQWKAESRVAPLFVNLILSTILFKNGIEWEANQTQC